MWYLLHLWMPVAMGWSLALALASGWQTRFDTWALITLLAGAFAVYSGDRLLGSSRVPRPWRRWLWVVTAIATALTAAVAMVVVRDRLILLAVVGAAAVAYPWIKRWYGCKTIVVACGWTLVCVLVPFADGVVWSRLASAPALAVLLLVTSGTVLCDIKDVAADRADGSATVPVMLGVGGARVAAAVMLVAVVVLGIVTGAVAWSGCAGILLALVACGRVLERPIAGPLLVDAALTTAGPIALVVGSGA